MKLDENCFYGFFSLPLVISLYVLFSYPGFTLLTWSGLSTKVSDIVPVGFRLGLVNLDQLTPYLVRIGSWSSNPDQGVGPDHLLWLSCV